jgi:hypothetical protein
MLRICGGVGHQVARIPKCSISITSGSIIRSPQLRKFSTTPPPLHQPLLAVPSQPPFAVRSLLVGTSVGLLTPFYGTAGVVVAWHRVLPKHPLIQAISTLVSAK